MRAIGYALLAVGVGLAVPGLLVGCLGLELLNVTERGA